MSPHVGGEVSTRPVLLAMVDAYPSLMSTVLWEAANARVVTTGKRLDAKLWRFAPMRQLDTYSACTVLHTDV